MSVQVARQPASAPHTWQVLWMGGEIDLATVDHLRDLLHSAQDCDRDVVLDLSEVTFMDCTGLGALLEAQRRLGDRFWLSGLQPPVRRLLDHTGLGNRFAVLAVPRRPVKTPGATDTTQDVPQRDLGVPRPRLRWAS